jgi:hypothetical protein
MLHKPQSHCSPNLIFADVLNNSYMHTIWKIPHFEKYEVKGQIWRPWIHNCPEYIGVIGHWKGHFISFEVSITWALYLNSGRSYATFSKTTCAKEMRFVTNSDVSCQKSCGHKAVKFGRNAYLNWDYSLTEIIQFCLDRVGNVTFLCLFDVEWPNNVILFSIWLKVGTIRATDLQFSLFIYAGNIVEASMMVIVVIIDLERS